MLDTLPSTADLAFAFLNEESGVIPAMRTFDASLYQRPFTILTFAQSLDGIIGHETVIYQTTNQPKPTPPLILSCNESMILTHAIRANCDAILVGVSTVIADDPRLSVRLVPVADPTVDNPRPVILDSSLRTPVTAKVLARNAIIIACEPTAVNASEFESRRRLLESKGATVCIVPTAQQSNGSKRVRLDEMQRVLWNQFRIRSLMVEGGASVISSFVMEPQLVDRIIITIAPRILGSGVRAIKSSSTGNTISLIDGKYKQFGTDMILSGSPVKN